MVDIRNNQGEGGREEIREGEGGREIRNIESFMVRGFSTPTTVVEVIKCQDKYFALTPIPVRVEGEEVEVKIVYTTDSLEEAYNILLGRILNNPDPFLIALKAMDDPIFFKVLKQLLSVEEIVRLPRAWFEYLEKRLREQEKKKPVIVEISLLKALVKIVRFLKEKGRTEQEIERIILSVLEPQEDENAYYYWNGYDLYRAVKLVEEEKERKKEREERKKKEKDKIAPLPSGGSTSSGSGSGTGSGFGSGSGSSGGSSGGNDIDTDIDIDTETETDIDSDSDSETTRSVTIQVLLVGNPARVSIVIAELQKLAKEHGVEVQIRGSGSGNYVGQ